METTVRRRCLSPLLTFPGRVAIYFFRFVLVFGARCDNTLAETVLAGLLVRLLRSSDDATFATRALVLRCATISCPFPLDYPQEFSL